MKNNFAKECLDKVIKKARVHFYKPIQIAEILYRDRIHKDINLMDLDTYRIQSRKWRDIICLEFLGRVSNSSIKYQDDLFNKSAVPPEAIYELAKQNRKNNGIFEAYIYKKFFGKQSQMRSALQYVEESGENNFRLNEFMNLFWNEPGLRRSIDKIYEIVSYSLFSILVEIIEVEIEVSYNSDKRNILVEFEQFAKKVIGIDASREKFKMRAEINRVGVTNAADRGLDMYANFGIAIQIKHLTLDEQLAEEITSSVTSKSIVIVCKDSEEKIISSIINQLGPISRVKSIITENELIMWYNKALNGQYSKQIATRLLKRINDEIINEFPSSNNNLRDNFIEKRGYDIS